LLDYRLVELMATMPAELRLGKLAIRHVMRHWGHACLADRSKHGFEVPAASWLRGPLREMVRDLLTSRDARVQEWVAPPVIGRLCEQHESRRHDHAAALWALLTFELWARTWQTAAQERSPAPIVPAKMPSRQGAAA
jgi:asparagine synthase (glutamine-hydrolysing)